MALDGGIGVGVEASGPPCTLAVVDNLDGPRRRRLGVVTQGDGMADEHGIDLVESAVQAHRAVFHDAAFGLEEEEVVEVGEREPSVGGQGAAAKAAEIVAVVAGWARAEERTIIEDAMVAVAEASSEHSAEVHLLELRRIAQSLRERERRARQCEAWWDRLAGLTGKVVEEMRDEIAAIEQGAIRAPGDFAGRVESCAAAAEAEADQRYAEQVLVEELAKLGYWVDTTLETVTAGDGQVLLAHPRLDEYRVEVGTTSPAAEGRVRLVRTGDGHDDPLSPAQRAATDTAHEERWCGDLARAIQRMEGRSVLGRIILSTRPGAAPVSRIRTASGQVPGRRRDRRRTVEP